MPADLGKHEVGVVYLNRYFEGEAPVRRFLRSYRQYSSGLGHDLIVIFKGFPDQEALGRASAVFSDIQTISFVFDDGEFDIGSYLQVARTVNSRYLLFLNTFSKIMAANWLYHFSRALALPQVGLVGATGSLLANTGPYEAAIVTVLNKMVGRAKQSKTTLQRAKKRRLNQYLNLATQYLVKYAQYGRFPNPHIRTNAFMLDRQMFLRLHFPNLGTKEGVYRFESGRWSLTRQVISLGLDPVVVDRNGDVYHIKDWKSSKTFWTSDQENLIVADNRTYDYQEADAGLRCRMELLAWAHPSDWSGRLPTT